MKPETQERLSKLLAMLSSDRPGEVAATVSAIGRTLKSAGLDWNDLARSVGQERADDYLKSPENDLLAYQSQLIRKLREEIQQLNSHIRKMHDGGDTNVRPHWFGLTRFNALAWLEALSGQNWLSSSEREVVSKAHADLWNCKWPAPRVAKIIADLVQEAWKQGARPMASDSYGAKSTFRKGFAA